MTGIRQGCVCFLLGLLFLIEYSTAQSYFTNLPSTGFYTITSDGTGTNLTAQAYYDWYDGTSASDYYYYSTNGGKNWTGYEIYGMYSSMASNLNSGQYVIATDSAGIFVSSNSGASFVKRSTSAGVNSNCAAISNTGQVMAIVGNSVASECLLYSSNYGKNFTATGPSGSSYYCNAMAMNADGSIVVIALYESGLWTSSNPTVSTSWTHAYSTSTIVNTIAFGGSNVYAGLYYSSNNLLLSTNNGITWTLLGSTTYIVEQICVDSTGTTVMVASDGIYYSTNSGATLEKVSYTNINECAMTNNPSLTFWSGQSDYLPLYYGNLNSMLPTSTPVGSPSHVPSPSVVPTIHLATVPTSIPASSPTIHPATLPTTHPAAITTAVPSVAISTETSTWTACSDTPDENWNSITTSQSGQYVVASAAYLLYQSTNYGSTWSVLSGAPSVDWGPVASDETGEFLVAGVNEGDLYLSYDYGASWIVAIYSNNFWTSVACSSNGQYVIASELNDVWVVNDPSMGGWFTALSSSTDSFGSVAMSSSGQYAAVLVDSGVYLSSNYGSSFTVAQSAPQLAYSDIVTDSSGANLYATVSYESLSVPNAGVVYSNNYGVSWFNSTAPVGQFDAVSCDTTGQFVMASIGCSGDCNGAIYLSNDYGATFALSTAPALAYTGLVSSGSGQMAFVSTSNGPLYVGEIDTTSGTGTDSTSSGGGGSSGLSSGATAAVVICVLLVVAAAFGGAYYYYVVLGGPSSATDVKPAPAANAAPSAPPSVAVVAGDASKTSPDMELGVQNPMTSQ